MPASSEDTQNLGILSYKHEGEANKKKKQPGTSNTKNKKNSYDEQKEGRDRQYELMSSKQDIKKFRFVNGLSILLSP